MDDREIVFERRRLHPRIDRREAAADIDDVDRNRGLDDGVADARHRFGERRRAHRLAADVEADAERVGRLAGGQQQRLHLVRLGAELRGEAELGMLRADADADEQVEVGRGNAVGRVARTIFSSSSMRVEAKVFTPWSK